jgi:hypothetical protein
VHNRQGSPQTPISGYRIFGAGGLEELILSRGFKNQGEELAGAVDHESAGDKSSAGDTADVPFAQE